MAFAVQNHVAYIYSTHVKIPHMASVDHFYITTQIGLSSLTPISANIAQLISRGMLSSKLFKYLRYLYPFKRYAKVLFMFKVLFVLNSDPLEFLGCFLLFTVKDIKESF